MQEKTESRADRAQAEGALLEPSLPHGGALPPALFANRPFTLFVAVTGLWGIRAGARHRRTVRPAFVQEAGAR